MTISKEEYFERTLANIEEHGWQFTFVFDPDGKDPDFAYTVGFPKSLNAPELIVCGLPRDLMSHMLWEMHRKLEKGEPIYDGARWPDLLEGFDCITKRAARADLYEDWVLSSVWHWEHCGNNGNPEVFQIVWPGARDGLFPWEDGSDRSVIDAQPTLWLEGSNR